MKWLEISLVVDREVAEAVADVLGRYAPGGVALELVQEGAARSAELVTVKAYLPLDAGTPRVQAQVEEALWHLGQISPIPAPTFSVLAESNWADAWKEHFHPLRVGRHIVIKPSWREYDANFDDIVIELDPGMAFGTGLHPTTQMCLEILEDKVRPGMRVLDFGTGSGILAVAAAKLGAADVLAIDNDPVAVTAAEENVQRNNETGRITIVPGSLVQATGFYDLVVVNILAKVIVSLAQEGLAERVIPGGYWLTAGMIESQVMEVKEALEATGLRVTAQRQVADWVTLIGDR